MQRDEQLGLIDELLGLKEQGQLFVPDPPSTNPVREYLCPERFAAEQQNIFSALPTLIAHSSELAGAHAFLRRKVNGLPVLLLRGDDGELRAFLNVCRHRGTRLVAEEQGCRKRFSCPYHAWTWNSRGEFVAAPHFEAGFPGLDKSQLGLKALRCIEGHGFVWLLPDDFSGSLDEFLGPLHADLAWAGTAGLVVHRSDQQLRHCNWKLISEGGLEAYHFRVAHRNTIASLFNDNLSSYQCFGPHLRSILPRASISELRAQPRESWNLRQHANLLYTLFPGSMLLVQSDHVIWIRAEPVAVDRTQLQLTTLKPADSAETEAYWDRNHALTLTTLNEDFDLAESMQEGLASGANEALNFGRFEGALGRFNQIIRDFL